MKGGKTSCQGSFKRHRGSSCGEFRQAHLDTELCRVETVKAELAFAEQVLGADEQCCHHESADDGAPNNPQMATNGQEEYLVSDVLSR